jgi:acylphosphatase
MYKSLRVTFSAAHVPEEFLQTFIQSKAKQLNLEGTAQLVKTEDLVRIHVFGKKDQVDTFIDALHDSLSEIKTDLFEVEPFLKEKDYRGVFRIVH